MKKIPIGKNKKVIRLTKNELGGKLMTKFAVLKVQKNKKEKRKGKKG